MMLAPEDINALAEALAPKIAKIMRLQEDRRRDYAYLATLPHEEIKKIQQEKMRKVKAEMKRQKEASRKS